MTTIEAVELVGAGVDGVITYSVMAGSLKWVRLIARVHELDAQIADLDSV